MILLYRVAIRLLASERMRAHADEMVETAAHLSADARSRGARHYARYWAREFKALLTTSLRTNTEGTMQYPDRKALPCSQPSCRMSATASVFFFAPPASPPPRS